MAGLGASRLCPSSSQLLSLAGQLAAGTCEIVTLDRDSSQPRRTIARQTARCACRKGQIAGTTRARPACVDGKQPGSSSGCRAQRRPGLWQEPGAARAACSRMCTPGPDAGRTGLSWASTASMIALWAARRGLPEGLWVAGTLVSGPSVLPQAEGRTAEVCVAWPGSWMASLLGTHHICTGVALAGAGREALHPSPLVLAGPSSVRCTW